MRRSIAILASVFAAANAHMWLDDPVSRGGTTNTGGTTGPCNNLAAKAVGSAARTRLVAGSDYTLVFRVNQHGDKPFRLSLAPTGATAEFEQVANVLADNFKYKITAQGGDNSDTMKLTFKVPNINCQGCTIQLKGMGTVGQAGGEWYNCADVIIGPPPVCPAACTTDNHGVCDGAKCVCNKGWLGADCALPSGDDGGVIMKVVIDLGTESSFDQNKFKSSLATNLNIPVASIAVLSATAVKGKSGQFEVNFKLMDVAATTGQVAITAVESASKVQTAANNSQLNVGYPIVSTGVGSTSSTSSSSNSSGKSKSKTPVVVGILVPVALLAVGAAAFFVLKSKNAAGAGSSSNRTPALPPRV